ncbi:hypothetical protein MFLAVUS_010213 [Mucor flavus]|uniref:Uncharacterized protein n=1 Tax=Mucor flavus TaxID=439312 RepID=A0ABP9ZC75_9FUNG
MQYTKQRNTVNSSIIRVISEAIGTSPRYLRFLDAERQITTYKTASLEIFTEYVRSVLNNLNTLLTYYDDRFTTLRFLDYIRRQRADAEMYNLEAENLRHSMQVEHNTAVSATSHGYEEQLRFQAAQHDFEEVSGMKNWNH